MNNIPPLLYCHEYLDAQFYHDWEQGKDNLENLADACKLLEQTSFDKEGMQEVTDDA